MHYIIKAFKTLNTLEKYILDPFFLSIQPFEGCNSSKWKSFAYYALAFMIFFFHLKIVVKLQNVCLFFLAQVEKEPLGTSCFITNSLLLRSPSSKPPKV